MQVVFKYYGPKMCDLRLAKRAMEIDDNLTKSTNTITEVNLKGIVDGYKRESLGHIIQSMKSESSNIRVHACTHTTIQRSIRICVSKFVELMGYTKNVIYIYIYCTYSCTPTQASR